MPAQQQGGGAMYDISPQSSIFADTRAAATSGGNFVFGQNPNLAAIFGGSSAPAWVMPVAVTVAVMLLAAGYMLMRRQSKK